MLAHIPRVTITHGLLRHLLNWIGVLSYKLPKVILYCFLIPHGSSLYYFIFFLSSGPYCNVVDLIAYSRQCRIDTAHTFSSIIYNKTEASLDKIWKTVVDVCNETSSAEVARAFVLAYRVMRLIREENGNNSWLSHGTPHCKVRKGFKDTPTGIVPVNTSFRIWFLPLQCFIL